MHAAGAADQGPQALMRHHGVGSGAMTLLDRVGAYLAGQDVRYAVIGAAALAVRGVARSTHDVDVLVVDRRVLDAAWWEALRADHSELEIDVRRGDHEDPLAGVVRLRAPRERTVDIVVGRHAWQTRALDRADRHSDLPPVVAARDLILLKLYAGGSQDLWDVAELLHLPEADRLIADVETDLASVPRELRRAWRTVLDRL